MYEYRLDPIIQRLYPDYEVPRTSLHLFDLSDDERKTIRDRLDQERDSPPLDQPEERARSGSRSDTEDDDSAAASATDIRCPICLSSLRSRIASAVPCGHSGHVRCLISAISVDRRCPCCRTIVTTIRSDSGDVDASELPLPVRRGDPRPDLTAQAIESILASDSLPSPETGDHNRICSLTLHDDNASPITAAPPAGTNSLFPCVCPFSDTRHCSTRVFRTRAQLALHVRRMHLPLLPTARQTLAILRISVCPSCNMPFARLRGHRARRGTSCYLPPSEAMLPTEVTSETLELDLLPTLDPAPPPVPLPGSCPYVDVPTSDSTAPPLGAQTGMHSSSASIHLNNPTDFPSTNRQQELHSSSQHQLAVDLHVISSVCVACRLAIESSSMIICARCDSPLHSNRTCVCPCTGLAGNQSSSSAPLPLPSDYEGSADLDVQELTDCGACGRPIDPSQLATTCVRCATPLHLEPRCTCTCSSQPHSPPPPNNMHCIPSSPSSSTNQQMHEPIVFPSVCPINSAMACTSSPFPNPAALAFHIRHIHIPLQRSGKKAALILVSPIQHFAKKGNYSATDTDPHVVLGYNRDEAKR
eukprot:g27489.t1